MVSAHCLSLENMGPPTEEESFNGAITTPSTGCILSPLSKLPECRVEKFLGHLDFFFVRESSDLKEIGGVRAFLHNALTEAQTVVGAHTLSLGGNALLSYHIGEFHLLRTSAKNHAQCLVNVCGDMALVASNGSQSTELL
ncbi:hypothetical protein Ciccas_007073 [Cichlidogyrus casuarinus]|uniref:C2CD5 C-terminal domain-containing protein n=1 Tax=Cichlidogyrus casuarinus TaxID=1844966 RepID=A0ABD2Q4H7_9PLAT